MFTWIPIHEEAIRRVLQYRQSQGELLAVLQEMEQQGLKVISLQDKQADGKAVPLAEIDPFTFLATFNRQISDERRQANWEFLKRKWKLESPVPQDFDGIPIVHPMVSRFFPFAADRAKDHVEHLWRIAAQAATNKVDQLDEGLFNRCVELLSVGIHKLTMALFWINPTDYLPADRKTRAYGHANGITAPPEDYRTYRTWMQQMGAKLGADYPAQSHTAHLEAMKKKNPPPLPEGRQFWLVAAGRQGGQWSDFMERGIISIGWDGTPDLRQYSDKEQIRQALQHMKNADSGKSNDALACWEFVHDITTNDIVFAKQGRTKVFGYGVVEGDYVFEPERQTHRHVRKVKWLNTGEWELPEDRQMPLKTLTNITDNPDLVAAIAGLVGLDLEQPQEKAAAPQPPTGAAYW